MRVCLRSLRASYLIVDPRSLGVFRIGLGCVLLLDLLQRYLQLDFWYTNQGLLPNHTLLWRPPAPHVFSFFFIASTAAEAKLGFLACALCYLLFVLGYRTHIVQWLTLICRISVNSRLAVLENGGDMVMNLLCIFGAFLPLDAAFSLDALASRRARAREPVVSLAVLGLLLQFAAVYLFNAASKSGAAWRDGSAVHYALHLDKYATGFGLWMRETLPIEVLRGLTWGVLATEWLGFVLLITPVFIHHARALAMVLMPLLHIGFALGLTLGTFSPAMIAFFPLLLTPVHWAAIERFCARRTRLVSSAAWLSARLAALQPSAAAHTPRPLGRWVREAGAALLIVAIATEALNDNTSVPQWLRVPRTDWAKLVIEYPRLLQGWRMFAPEPPKTDAMIYVDALTASGRHVDPYNAVASRYRFPAGEVVPAQMGSGQFFTMYSDRIAAPEYAVYRQAFLEWLLAYPARTGQPDDCLVRFDVYYVADQSPAPGELKPKPQQRTRFMDYSAPAGGPCKAKPQSNDPRSRPIAALGSRQ